MCVLLKEAGVMVDEAGELGMVQEENKQKKLLEDELRHSQIVPWRWEGSREVSTGEGKGSV